MDVDQTTVSVTDDTGTPLETQTLVPGFLPQDLHLQQVSKQAGQTVTPLVLDDVEDIVVIINYTVKP